MELVGGSIWFDEYPWDDAPQAKVLNGHIFAVYGLYYLYLHAGDEDVLALLNADITAIERHADLYRRPGQVNPMTSAHPICPTTGRRAPYFNRTCCAG